MAPEPPCNLGVGWVVHVREVESKENTMGDFEKWLHEASEAIGVDYEVLEPRINDLLDLTTACSARPFPPGSTAHCLPRRRVRRQSKRIE